MQRVFVIGGNGFLGYHAIREFLAIGWEATALGMSPVSYPDSNLSTMVPSLYPENVTTILRNLDDISDPELIKLMSGYDALVFAAGLDDRFTPKKPAYPKFYKANVDDTRRT